MLLADFQIEALCQIEPPMLAPFTKNQVTKYTGGSPLISFGLSSVGYDIRLAPTIKLFRATVNQTIIDPKNFSKSLMTEYVVDGRGYFEIPPQGYVLGVSVERFEMPQDVAAICLTKSTYARCGLLCNTTPIEPGWTGFLTLELANLTQMPIRVYTGEGIAQVLFFKHDRPNVSYSDRKGKYMDQKAVPVEPIVSKG